ncbi:hypothetical protein Vadar_034031 [Vaccinium darrowii]|uniref:Uncharacterized protein n=1 Tax=Vaccinium darrowii TaxID=229202 RepID=A0ACB7Z7Z4_9ERIC|nr:hypothetical protein Vadar_034031 [Vaccinium darrowii]
MSAHSPVTVTLPVGISSENVTTEEEDHLIRSTKKVKNDHDYSVDMAEDIPAMEKPQIEDTMMNNSEDVSKETPTQEKAPDGSGVQNDRILSFKEALIASRGKEIPFSEDVESIPIDEEITEEEENIDEEEEIDGIPVVKIPKSLLNYGRQPWKNAIIVKPIGYPIGYKSLCTKVRSIWDMQGDFSALEIGLGFVVFKFDMACDRTHVLTAGPWIINDQYITVREWEPRFKLDEAEEIKTAVWVRFPNFPLEYYYEKNMFRIAKRLGRPIRADSTTVETDRGRYARVCVEIDLSKPVKSRVLIEGKIYRVEYEHIPFMCFGCGRIRHRKDQCSWGPKTTPPLAGEQAPETPVTASTPATGERTSVGNSAQLPAYGQWTLVQRKPRRPNTGKRFTDRTQVAHNGKSQGPNAQRMDVRGNRFSLLNWYEASSSKRPHTTSKNNNEPKPSEPKTWAKVKNGKGPSVSSLDKNSPTLDSQPDPLLGSVNTTKPNTTQITPPSPVLHSSPPQNPNQHPNQTSPISSSQLQHNGNRDLPPPPSADLHPDQTQGRRRSPSKGHLVDSKSQDGSDGTRLQHSRSPVLCGGSGKSERHSKGPNGDQETCGME